jgi:hypothetical protein
MVSPYIRAAGDGGDLVGVVVRAVLVEVPGAAAVVVLLELRPVAQLIE